MKYNIFDYDDLPESIQSLAFDELNERFKEYEDSISKDQDEIIDFLQYIKIDFVAKNRLCLII